MASLNNEELKSKTLQIKSGSISFNLEIKESRQPKCLKYAFRFLNPELGLFTVPISTDLPEDFDDATELLESKKPKEPTINPDKRIYFLPSHLEEKMKNISNQAPKESLPDILKPFIPQNIVDEKKMTFCQEEHVEVTDNSRVSNYSVSFFKTELEETELEENAKSELARSIKAVLEFKKIANIKYISTLKFFFIGNITINNDGFLQKSKKKTIPNPKTFHYNYWSVPNEIVSTTFVDGFSLYSSETGALYNDQ